MRKSLSGQGLRFLVVGGINSAATYLLYLLLLLALPYAWAYTLSYGAGILLSFVLNSLFVFRVPLRLRKLVPFPFVYLLQYALGIGVLALAVGRLGLDARLGPLAVLLVTVPVSFVMMRWVLREGGDEGEARRKSG